MATTFSSSFTASLASAPSPLERRVAGAPGSRGIYEKTRPVKPGTRRQGGQKFSRLLCGRPAPGRSVVQENSLNFLVDLEEGLNTGLFLDQRRNRLDLMERVRGKKVLNLFAYTGAFRWRPPLPARPRSAASMSLPLS